jgi:hypothetical protein
MSYNNSYIIPYTRLRPRDVTGKYAEICSTKMWRSIHSMHGIRIYKEQ